MAKVGQKGLKRNVENSFQNGKGKPKKALRGMWKTAFIMAKEGQKGLKRNVENSF